MGLRSITIAKDSVKPGGYFGDKTPNSLAIIKCHQDEVWELPESATLLAYSDKYNVEMASYGDHLLSIQGHPEYNKEILFEIIDRVVSLKLMEVCFASVSPFYIYIVFDVTSERFFFAFLQQDLADKAKATMEEAEPDRKQWQTLCKNFLKGKTDQI